MPGPYLKKKKYRTFLSSFDMLVRDDEYRELMPEILGTGVWPRGTVDDQGSSGKLYRGESHGVGEHDMRAS